MGSAARSTTTKPHMQAVVFDRKRVVWDGSAFLSSISVRPTVMQKELGISPMQWHDWQHRKLFPLMVYKAMVQRYQPVAAAAIQPRLVIRESKMPVRIGLGVARWAYEYDNVHLGEKIALEDGQGYEIIGPDQDVLSLLEGHDPLFKRTPHSLEDAAAAATRPTLVEPSPTRSTPSIEADIDPAAYDSMLVPEPELEGAAAQLEVMLALCTTMKLQRDRAQLRFTALQQRYEDDVANTRAALTSRVETLERQNEMLHERLRAAEANAETWQRLAEDKLSPEAFLAHFAGGNTQIAAKSLGTALRATHPSLATELDKLFRRAPLAS